MFQQLMSYQTRSRGKFLHMSCRTECFANLYFPYTIKEWNDLSVEIWKSVPHEVFKNQLLKFLRPNLNSLFNVSDSLGIKLLTRLRLSLSHLWKQIQPGFSGHYKSALFLQFRSRVNMPFFSALPKFQRPL